MLEGGGGLGCRVEPPDECGIGGDALVESLDGNVAFDVRLDGAEDDAVGPS